MSSLDGIGAEAEQQACMIEATVDNLSKSERWGWVAMTDLDDAAREANGELADAGKGMWSQQQLDNVTESVLIEWDEAGELKATNE